MFGWKSKRVVELEATLRERDRQFEILRNDYDQLRADYTALTAVVSNMAQRPLGNKALMDQDIYREDDKQPDSWVSPDEGEIFDPEELLDKISEAQVGSEGNERE